MRMKRLMFTLSVLLCALCMNAQNGHTPVAVENPGSKGPLPQLPVVTPLEEGRFFGLSLTEVGYSSIIFNGHYSVEATLSWPKVEAYEADYYTLQYSNHGENNWTDYGDSDGAYHYKENTVGASPRIYAPTDYRLILHGGKKDGYISNVVTANPPSMLSRQNGWGHSEPYYTVVGNPVGKTFNLSVTSHVDNKNIDYNTDENPDYFTYQWYRQNPNNGELTPIKDATERTYTPTIDDVGYVLLLELGGDNKHISFTYRITFSDAVVLPILAQPIYVDNDGFVLNTDYDLPNFEDLFYIDGWNEDGDYTTPFKGVVTERQPGTYAVHLAPEQYNYGTILSKTPGLMLTFLYNWGQDQQGNIEYTYREAQIMSDRYKAPICVKSTFAGRELPTTVDIIGRNIEGEWAVKKSVEVTDAEGVKLKDDDGLSTLNDYYLKAHATTGTLDTYYPSALFWSEAAKVEPGEKWEEKTVEGQDYPDWVSIINTYTVEAKEAPAPLTGSGVIEGSINQTADAAAARRAEATDNETVMVYLKQKSDGTIIAQTTTDATGKFRFENVPFGDFQVVANIDGCTTEQPIEVTLTAEQPTATGVDYVVEGTAIVSAEASGISATRLMGTARTIYTLDGRRTSTLQHGLNVVRMPDGSIRKILK